MSKGIIFEYVDKYAKDIIPHDRCDGILIVAREIRNPAIYRVIKASDYIDKKITVYRI
nr:MAG TPA: hypothetical protein [Caudoviricetes sp.]